MMNGKTKILLGIALVGTTTALMAGHCHHDDGLHLAAGIVNLVSAAVAPRTVVVAHTPAVVTTQVAVAPVPCCHQAPPPKPHRHGEPCRPGRPEGGEHRPCEPCRCR